jgi:hypothetical protein
MVRHEAIPILFVARLAAAPFGRRSGKDAAGPSIRDGS